MGSVVLVLLPGLDGTGELFAPFLKVLPAYLEPIVIAYPADKFLNYKELGSYVRSQLPDDKPFVILGESFSGPVAVTLAATQPAGLKAFILCASFVTNPMPVGWRWLRFIVVTGLFRRRPPPWLVRCFLLGPGASAALVSAVTEVLSAVAPEVLAARVRYVMRAEVRAELKKSRVPMLYLAARYDRLVGVKSCREIATVATNVEVVTVNAPHLLLQREPEAAARAIDKFLRPHLSSDLPKN